LRVRRRIFVESGKFNTKLLFNTKSLLPTEDFKANATTGANSKVFILNYNLKQLVIEKNNSLFFLMILMTHILEVKPSDIQKLDEGQLTDLLLRLLRLEARKCGIPVSSISGTLNTKAKDGGEDACIRWSEKPEKTDWIPNHYTLFQCKATGMPPSKCSSEIVSDGKLKPRIKEVFDNNGSYILFCIDDCTSQSKEDRIKAFRDAIKSTRASYHDTVDIQIYDANSIRLWTNDYISLIIQVHRWTGKNLPHYMSTWEDWSKYRENNVDYVLDQILSGYISQLKNYFTGTKKVARIIGLSGLGKTRLALEVFRPPKDSPKNIEYSAVTDQVVYIDAVGDSSRLQVTIKQWREQELEGILVVDNCELELHQRLRREVEHSNSRLSLLTLDYNPELNDDDYVIKLERVSNDVIKEIIKQTHSELPDPYINRIVEFAQGFPQIAVKLAEANFNEVHDLRGLSKNALRDKLIWGRKPENEVARKVIVACSLFTHLGFSDDVVDQSNFVAEHICNISKDDFYEYTMNFIEHGILDRRNRFVRVVPMPLAIGLAIDWWKGHRNEKVIKLITNDMPDGMAEALCDQISKLNYLPEAVKVIEELCSNSAPFGKFEVLNSEKGSRLFRSLAEVNPLASIEALERVFGNCTIEKLLQVGLGRRNLIWTLEKLCFWRETFSAAAKIMLSFAAAENESCGNNATGQFLQLFHVGLSGTQAPPNARLEVIDEALNLSDIESKVLAVKALGSALTSYHFFRILGVECQGSRLPQEDWRPESCNDVFNYWHASLGRLIPIACGDDKLGKLAQKQILDNFRSLVQYNFMDDIEAALIKICKENGVFWPEIYNEIEEFIFYEGSHISEENLNRLKKWMEMLKPSLLDERLKLIISTPSHEFKKNEEGHYINLSHDKAVLLANEFSEDITPLLKHLNLLYEGEQINGFIFGYALGESLTSPEIFVEKSLYVMKKINPSELNSDVLGGLLSAIKTRFPEFVEKTLDDVAQDEALHTHTVYLTRYVKPSHKDLRRLIKLIREGKVRVKELRMIGLSHESPKTVISFCDNLIQFGYEGLLSALEILFHYTANKPDKFEVCKEKIRIILLTPGIISDFDRNSLINDYYLAESIEIFLFKGNEDLELASHISNEIIGICGKNGNIYLFKHFLEPIIQGLLLRYKDISWPIFGTGLLSEDLTLKYNIMGLFDSLNSSEDSNKSVLSELPPGFLIEWCKKEPNKAPLLIAKMVPIFTKNVDSWSLHPLAKSLVDNYGARPDVLLEIDRNLGTFFWSDSVIPYYEKQIEVMEQLSDHNIPNVCKWAKKNVTHLRKEIEYEMKKEEEKDLGIF
jgi:hypothetical protein